MYGRLFEGKFLTTSIICCSVNPKKTSSACDSLATGRSNTLYFLRIKISSNNRFSLGPLWVSESIC